MGGREWVRKGHTHTNQGEKHRKLEFGQWKNRGRLRKYSRDRQSEGKEERKIRKKEREGIRKEGNKGGNKERREEREDIEEGRKGGKI